MRNRRWRKLGNCQIVVRICIFASHGENLCFSNLYLCIFALATRSENLCRAGLLRFYISGISCSLVFLLFVFSVLVFLPSVFVYFCIGVFAERERGVCNFLYFCIFENCICVFVFVYLYMYLCICVFLYLYLFVFVHSQSGSKACVIWCPRFNFPRPQPTHLANFDQIYYKEIQILIQTLIQIHTWQTSIKYTSKKYKHLNTNTHLAKL